MWSSAPASSSRHAIAMSRRLWSGLGPPAFCAATVRRGRPAFLRPNSRWGRLLRTQPDHRLWETAVLFHLRDAFRAGDVWLARSRRYGDIRAAVGSRRLGGQAPHISERRGRPRAPARSCRPRFSGNLERGGRLGQLCVRLDVGAGDRGSGPAGGFHPEAAGGRGRAELDGRDAGGAARTPKRRGELVDVGRPDLPPPPGAGAVEAGVVGELVPVQVELASDETHDGWRHKTRPEPAGGRGGGARIAHPSRYGKRWSTGAEVAGAPWQTRRPPPQEPSWDAPADRRGQQVPGEGSVSATESCRASRIVTRCHPARRLRLY